MNEDHVIVDLFAIRFTAGGDAGLALVVARSELEAIQILKNSGSHNYNNGNPYTITRVQDLGLYTLDEYGLIMEMYANALISYEAILKALDSFISIQGPPGPPGPPGPKGDKGDKGNKGDKGDKGDTGDRGQKGDKGEPGETGPQGAVGPVGATGVGIVSIQQITSPTTGGGVNVIRIMLSNGVTTDFQVRNGLDAEVTLESITSALGYTPASSGDLNNKQDTLVSGINIKSINNMSLLGSGDITIEGGGGDTSNCVKVEAQTFSSSQQAQARTNIGAGTSSFSGAYNDLTGKPTIPAAQIQSDWNQANSSSLDFIKNKPSIPAAQIQSDWNQTDNTAFDFIKNKPTIPSVSGFEETSNKTSSLSSSSTNTQYPSAKAAYDEIHPASGSSQPSGGMLPNVLYNLGTLTGSVAFTLATPSDANVTNHYYWTFNTGSTAPTITWPSGITSWMGSSTPTIAASKHYEVSVLNGIGVYFEV